MSQLGAGSHQAYASGASPPGPGQISSSRCSVSSDSAISSARRLPVSCSIVRGPMIGAVTTGLLQQPGQRDVGGLLAQLAAEAFVGLQLAAVLLDPSAACARRRAGPRWPSGARRRAARRRAGSRGSAPARSARQAGMTSSSIVRAFRL